VTSNSQTAATDTLPRGILLLEEYGALAVAISSALHKFAPLHSVRVAHNLAEAEVAAEATRPELFVLDLDPPPSGQVEFFNKLKARYPNSRALVIAAGTSRELRAERGTAGAIQFLEKPFDLADFGAAVQALLGPWGGPPSTNLRGTLGDLNVLDIVQLKCLSVSTAAVRIVTADGKYGEIYFRNGQVCHAAAGMMGGLAAFEEIVSWPGGILSEVEFPAETPKTINLAWPALLLPVARKLAEQDKKKSVALAANHPPIAKTGKKILVIDDTEMLLIFVADVLATADQTFQIITASTGAEGLRLAAAARPDLVLLDYSLTDTTGDKVCRALRENEVTACIPVLMMSGHPTELARTAQDNDNVVAALPKPFLSGELMNTVETVLAAGPLPKASPARLLPRAAPARPMPAPEFPTEGPAIPLPNGQGGSGDGLSPIPAAPPPAASELPKSTTIELPPGPALQVPARPMENTPVASIVRQKEVGVTLFLQAVSIQLTPFFRLAAIRLEPASPIVAVKMGERAELNGGPLETEFRLGKIELRADGTVDTIRLIPTRQSPQLHVTGSSFAIGALGLHPANSRQNVEITATPDAAMRVQLTARFAFLTVELSERFEVAAVLLKARGTQVFVRNGAETTGAPFELQGAELDPSAQLRNLLVRALP
jgi:DNA-binding response OmpR family regulator